MSNVAINIAAEFVGKPAFKQADKATLGLDKSVKKLAKSLGLAFSVTAVVKFGKAAAKAFIQDQKEATRLANVVKNLGLEFANPAINQYIDSLSRASGITDGELRPAFQSLLTTTGSITESQKLLKQAIDVSAGSGIALTTVSQDLANAYIGVTRGLRKYNLGLTQAQLKSVQFTEVSERLNKQFSGANAAYLDTYAGKMQALSTAAGEAQEKLGAAIIDFGMAFTGSQDLDDLITKIDSLTDKAVAFLDRMTEGVAILNAIRNSSLNTLQKNIQAAQVEQFNRRLRRDYMKAWEGVNIPLSPQQTAAMKAAEDAARKRAQALKKEEEKRTKELKKQAALKKAGSVFDMEQIQILAALRGNISAEDRRRLEAQAAILNGNVDLASKLTKDILMAQDKTGGLYQYFLSIGDVKIKNPFAFLDDWIIKFQEKLNNLKIPTMPTGGGGGSTAVAPVNGIVPNFIPPDLGIIATPGPVQGPVIPKTNVGTIPTGNFTYGQGNPLNTGVYIPPVELRITGDGDLTNAIAKSLQNQSLSTGDPAYINRRTGGFAG